MGKSITYNLRVLISSPYIPMTQGLEKMIKESCGFEVCGIANQPNEALDLIETTKPDVILTELYDIYPGDLTRTVRDIETKWKEIYGNSETSPLLVVSILHERFNALPCSLEGAKGYFMMEHVNKERLENTIEKIAFKKEYWSLEMGLRKLHWNLEQKRNIKDITDLLTPRQKQVFYLTGLGLSGKEAGIMLEKIDQKTVSTYICQIMDALGLANTTEVREMAALYLLNNPDKNPYYVKEKYENINWEEKLKSLNRKQRRLIKGEENKPLTDMEIKVFNLLGLNYGSRTIAELLNKSAKTISSHIDTIKKRFEVQNISQARGCAIAYRIHQKEAESKSIPTYPTKHLEKKLPKVQYEPQYRADMQLTA